MTHIAALSRDKMAIVPVGSNYSSLQISVWQSRNPKPSPWLCLTLTPPLPEGEGE